MTGKWHAKILPLNFLPSGAESQRAVLGGEKQIVLGKGGRDGQFRGPQVWQANEGRPLAIQLSSPFRGLDWRRLGSLDRRPLLQALSLNAVLRPLQLISEATRLNLSREQLAPQPLPPKKTMLSESVFKECQRLR